MDFVTDGKYSCKSSLGILNLGYALLLDDFLTRQESETIEACASQDLPYVLDKSGMEDWSGKLNVAEMTWAICLGYTTNIRNG